MPAHRLVSSERRTAVNGVGWAAVILGLALGFGSGCGLALASGDLLLGGAPAGPLPGSGEGRYLGEYAISYYWIAVEDPAAPGPREVALRDAGGDTLALVTPAFQRELDREGTGLLRDGRVINVATRRADGFRYVELAPGSFGLGANGFTLVPFVSVAADPERIPPGAPIVVPALACLPLPDGEPHSGRFVVHDVGSAIRGPRIDVFIADRRLLGRFEEQVPTHSRVSVFLEEH